MIRTLALVALTFTSTHAAEDKPIDLKPFIAPMKQMNEEKVSHLVPALVDLGKRMQLERIHVTASASGVLVTFESLPEAFQTLLEDYNNKKTANLKNEAPPMNMDILPFATSLINLNTQKVLFIQNELARIGQHFGFRVDVTAHIGGLVVRMDTHEEPKPAEARSQSGVEEIEE